jgi:GDPmannose 4,6-dehydratase
LGTLVGRTESGVHEFVECAFDYVGLDWKNHVEIDPRYHRPTEVDVLLGDATKAREILGWEPKVKFRDLVELMVDADAKLLNDQLEGRLAHEPAHREVEFDQIGVDDFKCQ